MGDAFIEPKPAMLSAAAWAKSPHLRSLRGHQRVPSRQRVLDALEAAGVEFTNGKRPGLPMGK
jgi:hypothetical protein